jgi:hypothetical protein
LHSKQPCCSGEDASSVAKDNARPTLHQIAEWLEQTVAAPEPTRLIKNEISLSSKNIKKTWNFLSFATVRFCKQPGFIAARLTVKRQVIPEHFQQGN